MSCRDCKILVPCTLDEEAYPLGFPGGPKQQGQKFRSRPVGGDENIDGPGFKRDVLQMQDSFHHIRVTTLQRRNGRDTGCEHYGFDCARRPGDLDGERLSFVNAPYACEDESTREQHFSANCGRS